MLMESDKVVVDVPEDYRFVELEVLGVSNNGQNPRK